MFTKYIDLQYLSSEINGRQDSVIVIKNMDGSIAENDDGKKLASQDFIQKEMSTLLGKVLTLVDASVTGQQNKAMKDVIKGYFVEEYVHLTDLMYDKEQLKEDISGEYVEVTEDEALGIK